MTGSTATKTACAQDAPVLRRRSASLSALAVVILLAFGAQTGSYQILEGAGPILRPSVCSRRPAGYGGRLEPLRPGSRQPWWQLPMNPRRRPGDLADLAGEEPLHNTNQRSTSRARRALISEISQTGTRGRRQTRSTDCGDPGRAALRRPPPQPFGPEDPLPKSNLPSQHPRPPVSSRPSQALVAPFRGGCLTTGSISFPS